MPCARAWPTSARILPAGTTLEVTQDGGEDAQNSLDNVVHALVFGAGLTVLVVYVFLNSWRSTLITALSLPTSVIASFIAVWLAGFTLNFMSLLGLSLAIGVLIDDAIVVRENIVRHLERGADRVTAALKGTAEIGLAVAATTFSIVAVFVPVAFMDGITGQWFRPFAITVVASVMVSLFISFTLDPMLSAYWGDPPGHDKAEKRGISLALQKFNLWFDHQADRYGNVIAWALHHRKWMFFLAITTLAAAIALHLKFGGSSFLPVSDAGTLAVDVRTPASSSLEYAKLKVEAVAALARTLPEAKATNSNANPNGGRVYVDIGKSTERKRTHVEVAKDLRALTARLVGAEYVVLEDFNMGAQKPVQIRFTGVDSRKLLEISNEFMTKLRQVPGAVDVGLSEQDPQNELKIELDRGLANALGISAADAAQALRVAFAGVEVGDWVDPAGETRDVAVRLAPEDRVDASNIERLPVAVGTVAGGANRVVPLEQIATITIGKAPSQIQHSDGKRQISVSANAQGRASGEVTADALKIAKAMRLPAGLRPGTRRRVEGPAGSVRPHGRGALRRHRADVPDPRHPVQQLHRAAAGDVLAAAVTDRRRHGALADQEHAESDELHRRHHADGPGRQERDPAARRCARRRARRRRSRRSADARRPQTLPPDPDDDLRVGGRHDAGGDRCRRRRRVLPPDGRVDHRRHDHVDAADAACHPELLRLDRDRA